MKKLAGLVALATVLFASVVFAVSSGENEWSSGTSTITRYLSPTSKWWIVSVSPYTQNVDVVFYSFQAAIDTMEVPAGFTANFEKKITHFSILRAVATDGIDHSNPARDAGNSQ